MGIRKRSKGLAAVMIAVMLLVSMGTLTAAGSQEATPAADDGQLRMVMVTNVSGLGDEGFNDAAWKGFERARDELGAEIQVIESGEQSQYVPNLQAAAEQSYDLIVAVGFLLVDSVAQAAGNYPDSNFVIIDGTVDQPNVVSVLFKENEAAYLSGIIAGLTTETGKVGFLGGMETPPVIRFESGWRAGVATVDPDIGNVINFVGSFANPGAGKEQAKIMYGQGIDIIQGVAGSTEIGIIEAAKELDKWVIPCDRDKTELCAGQQLTSSVKKIDEAVMTVAKAVVAGNFPGGTTMALGLAEDAVGYPDTALAVVDPEIMKIVNQVKTRIVSGEIKVPSTREELVAFKPPML
jgi:basic membrane protein A